MIEARPVSVEVPPVRSGAFRREGACLASIAHATSIAGATSAVAVSTFLSRAIAVGKTGWFGTSPSQRSGEMGDLVPGEGKRRCRTARIRGLVSRRSARLARSEVWYRATAKFWQNGAVWYLFAAGSEVWYPPLGESRGLVPAKAVRAFRDQAFLRASGTKSPKLAEIGVPNLEIRQNQSWIRAAGCQTGPLWRRDSGITGPRRPSGTRRGCRRSRRGSAVWRRWA